LSLIFPVAILAYHYLAKHEAQREELYILLVIATLGAAVRVASSHFASFSLDLEVLSVSLYTMVSYLRPSRQPLEAGIKYLILAATSAAFLLFGMALIYADLGTMEFGSMAQLLGAGTSQ
jgi:NADH-quinone oxidoreductase subunit N